MPCATYWCGSIRVRAKWLLAHACREQQKPPSSDGGAREPLVHPRTAHRNCEHERVVSNSMHPHTVCARVLSLQCGHVHAAWHASLEMVHVALNDTAKWFGLAVRHACMILGLWWTTKNSLSSTTRPAPSTNSFLETRCTSHRAGGTGYDCVGA